MAFTAQHNISNNSTTELFSPKNTTSAISSLAVANTHDTEATFCNLFLFDGVSTFYILKNALVPKGTTLIVGQEAFSIQQGQGLYVKLVGDNSSTSSATITIKT